MSPPTKTTSIHPLTPSQTTKSPPISSSSAPPRRRSLRLAAISISEPPQTHKPSARVSKSKLQKSNLSASESDSKSKHNQTDNSPVNLRSGKKYLKRGITIANEDDSENNASLLPLSLFSTLFGLATLHTCPSFILVSIYQFYYFI